MLLMVLKNLAAPRNLPLNLWVLVTGMAAPVTGWALGEGFGTWLFHPDRPAGVLGGITLTTALWAASLVPLYFAELPLTDKRRRIGVALLLAGALALSLLRGPGLAAEIETQTLKPLGYAFCFWAPVLFIGLPLFFVGRDAFDEPAHLRPGILAALAARMLDIKELER